MVTAAVVIEDGRLMIAKRAGNGPGSGKWELPGGKMEHGETLRECLTRELKEELGIDAQVEAELGRSPVPGSEPPLMLVALKACIIAGRPLPSVHSAIAWAAPGELDSYDFSDADVPLIKLAKDLMKGGG